MQPSEVNPSANPSSSICSGKSDDAYDAVPPKDLLDQEFEIHQIQKPAGRDNKIKLKINKIIDMNKIDSSDSNVIIRSQISKTSRPSIPKDSDEHGSKNQSCQNLLAHDLLPKSMAENMENSKLAPSINKNRWSGGVSAQTQMKFNQVLNNNK